MSQPKFENILPRLLENGQIKEDLSGFSDDELQLGLMMLIDNLEAYDDAARLLVNTPIVAWREDLAHPDKEWERQQAIYAEPMNDPAERGDRPWEAYVAKYSPKGGNIRISQLTRTELEGEIRKGWDHLLRCAQAARELSRVAEASIHGVWFDSTRSPTEIDKSVPVRKMKP